MVDGMIRLVGGGIGGYVVVIRIPPTLVFPLK